MSDKAFRIDNPFWDLMGLCADYVIVNLLFLLTSMPVVTMGASISAMHETIRLLREGKEGAIHRTYFRLLIKNFGQSTKRWLLLLAAGCILGADFYIVFTARGGALQPALLIALTVLMTVWSMIFSWSFVIPDDLGGHPVKSCMEAFRHAVLHFPVTLVMVAVESIPLAVLIISFRTFAAVALPLYMVCGFSLSALICGWLADRAVRAVQ